MTSASPRNRLHAASSPYLRQHAGNPVDWYPWGEEALQRARQEDKPIFLSIGYAACHWCHVMERESFESAEVAAFLNEHFVSIKVDREERPDVDAVYMEAVQAISGSAGWPLTVFLTPTLLPLYGGTYFPPEPRWGRPSFKEVLVAVLDAWQQRRGDLLAQSNTLVERLAAASSRDRRRIVDAPAAGQRATGALARRFDTEWGGFDGAPKFPSPARLFLLLHAAARGDTAARTMLSTTLDAMARGGMYDWVGGGFHRYSVDDRWLCPHFEKMLYDNALLARLYGEAGAILGRTAWLAVARETADYLLREMQGPEGGLYASTDADSEGEEGRYFTWTPDEIAAALPADQAAVVLAACGVTREGNFEHGRSILRPKAELDSVAASLGLSPGAAAELLQHARLALRAARSARTPPPLDDKRLAGWNGMAVWALAYLGVVLDERKFVNAAQRAGDFLLRLHPHHGGPLMRAWREGVASGAETLEDVAWVATGLAELYQVTGELRYLIGAAAVLRRRLPHYRDEATGALLDTPDDGEPLPLRPRSPHDGATPSPAGVAARACLTVAALTEDESLRRRAEDAVNGEGALLAHAPEACAALLLASLEAAQPPSQLVLIGDGHTPGWEELLRTALTSPRRPTAIALCPSFPVPPEVIREVPIFAGRGDPATPLPAAYLCRGLACDPRRHDARTLAAALAELA